MIRTRFLCMALLVLLFTAASHLRSAVFQDEFTYWSATVVTSPNKARPYNNLGRTLLAAGRPRDAFPLVTRALTIDPLFLDAHFNLAMLYVDAGMPGDAEREFSFIIERYPGTKQAAFSKNMLNSFRSAVRP